MRDLSCADRLFFVLCRGQEMESDEPKSLSELQAIVDGWIGQLGVRYFSELTNLAVLMDIAFHLINDAMDLRTVVTNQMKDIVTWSS